MGFATFGPIHLHPIGTSLRVNNLRDPRSSKLDCKSRALQPLQVDWVIRQGLPHSGEVDVPSDPGFTRAVNQTEQMSLFRHGGTSAYQKDESRVFPVLGQLKEIISIAGDQHSAFSNGVGEGLLIRAGYRQCILKNHHVMPMAKQRIGDRTRNVVIEKESHSPGALD